MKFAILAVVAVVCGLLIGAGLHMALDVVVVCTAQPQVIGQPQMASCHGLDQYTKTQAAMIILMTGALAGVIPRTPQFRGMVKVVTRGLEKKQQDGEIREYFERYG